jgi:predicted nuclease of predicted toxin-antitoxin system
VKFFFDHDVPDDLSYLLRQFGHEVIFLRDALSTNSSDSAVLQYAHDLNAILVTCNRDDFLQLAEEEPHPGIIILIRRKSRAQERASLFQLLESAGETGLRANINFA